MIEIPPMMNICNIWQSCWIIRNSHNCANDNGDHYDGDNGENYDNHDDENNGAYGSRGDFGGCDDSADPQWAS